MSQLAANQIPKPADEQAFERCNMPLWRYLLKDPNVKRVGRRGQAQHGVDICGRRDRDPNHLVGVQCKLKGPGGQLTEKEVRAELDKALEFEPALSEYFIVTTAPDHAPIEALARKLTQEQHAKGRNLEINVWGWNTLEERIVEDTESRQAFDPSFTPFGAQLAAQLSDVGSTVAVFRGETRDSLGQMQSQLERLSKVDDLVRLLTPQIADDTARQGVEAALDAQIDDTRELISSGDAAVAQAQFEKLWERVASTASGRIRFRIEANIGACRLALGDDVGAAERLVAAYDHAPEEPKAILNKILGLMLRKDWPIAQALAAEAIAKGNEDPTLASYLVQASRFDPSVIDPLAMLPVALQSTLAVRVATVDFRRHRNDAGWKDAARALAMSLPDEDHARRMAAEADLEDALSDPDFDKRQQLPPKMRVRVAAAVEELRAQWGTVISGADVPRPDAAGLCANLILGLHMLEDLGCALAVAEQGVKAFPDDAELARYAAIVGMDAGDNNLLDRLMPVLEREPAGRVIAFRHNANRANWTEVLRLLPDALAAAPESERVIIEVLGKMAAVKAAQVDPASRLTAILEEIDEDPRAAILIASAARIEGLDEVADQAYQKSKSLLTPDSHIARRLMVAQFAVKLDDWSVVADALDGWVETGADSEELRVLARAFVNETPVRRRGARFFQSLPAGLKAMPAYSQAEGLFHLNRGALQQAEDPLRRASRDGKLLATLALFETLTRLGRADEIGALVADIDPRTLIGDPDDQMRFARAMRKYGNPEGAGAFAYEVLQSAPDDAEAAMGYFGLVVSDSGNRLIPEARVVGPDVWVDLRSDDGGQAQFLVVSENPRPSENRVTPDHPMIQPAIGLGVNETFVLDTGPAGPRTWRVHELKHKYLHTFHDICENFETRFPDAKGLWRIQVKGDDISPALDMIKRMGEADDRNADLYLEKGLPLCMVATRVTGSSVSFADHVRNRGHDIETAIGLDHERGAALEIIRSCRKKGVVLDTYSAWTIATMDAFDVLKRVFGEIWLPQSALDELGRLRSRIEPTNGESLTIGWSGGEFNGQRLDADQSAERLRGFDEILDRIASHCVVAPVEAPDTLTPIEELIAKVFGSHILDSAYLAADRVLLSEDRHYRDAVRQIQGVSSVWLQSVLIWARDSGELSAAAYAAHVLKLAHRRHTHLGVDSGTLDLVLRADQSADLVDFIRVCRYLGGNSADMISHLAVVIRFLNYVWAAQDIPRLKSMKATSILLDAVTREKSRPWADVLFIMWLELTDEPRNHLWGWIKGHFLPISALREAETRFMSREGWLIRQAIRVHGRRSHHRPAHEPGDRNGRVVRGKEGRANA